jgi:hypothetical protein
MEHQTDGPDKCSICGGPILDGGVLRDHGDCYHARCNDIAKSDGFAAEAPAVLCVICRTGIASTRELGMTASGVIHVRCRPAQN